MAKQTDWLINLTRLGERFDSAADSIQELYSGIVYSRNRTHEDLKCMFDLLEPAYSGGKLLRSIQLPAIAGIGGELLYLYFGPDQRSMDDLVGCLEPLPALLASMPDGVLPNCTIPGLADPIDDVLVRWTSLIYSMAWKFDSKFLKAHLEFQWNIRNFTFDLWRNFPFVLTSDPKVWVTLGASSKAELQLADAELRAAKSSWPDVIDAYLIEDLYYCSSAAIDTLSVASKLDSTHNEKENESSVPRPSRPARQSLKTTEKIEMLRLFLATCHQQGNIEPLTQQQIAERMGWSQASVSRYISEAYPNGMKDYISSLSSRNRYKDYYDPNREE